MYTTSNKVIIKYRNWFKSFLGYSYDATTFENFAKKLFNHVINLATTYYGRIDIIYDCYFEGSLKNQTGDDRGSVDTAAFDKDTKFPPDFEEHHFKNSKNKNRLNTFLATEFLLQYSKPCSSWKAKLYIIHVKSLVRDITLSTNSAEEADRKLVRHALQCIRSGFGNVVVSSVDTDVMGPFKNDVTRVRGMGYPKLLTESDIGEEGVHAISDIKTKKIC